MSLDISLRNTGVCIFRAEDNLVYWTTISPPDVLSTVKRISYNTGMIGVLADVFNVREVAFEDYAYHAHGTGNTQLLENTGAIKQRLSDRNINLFPYGIQTVRKWAMGHGDPSRDRITIEFARKARKRKNVDEHVQDAFFIGRYHYDRVRRHLLGEI